MLDDVVGELELGEADRMLHPVGAARRTVGVKIESTLDRRLWLRRSRRRPTPRSCCCRTLMLLPDVTAAAALGHAPDVLVASIRGQLELHQDAVARATIQATC